MTAANVIPISRDQYGMSNLMPPHDLNAEAAVLSAVMLDETLLARVADFLQPAMFFSGQHRLLYAAALELRQAGTPIDVLTVESLLRTKQLLHRAGGAGFLAEVLGASPAVRNITAHAEAVHSTWRARECIEAARRIVANGYGAYGDVQAFADGAVSSFERIARETLGTKPASNLEVIKGVLRGYLKPIPGSRTQGIPYGIPGLDRLTAGMHSAQKITVCAQTGRGKTVLGLQACVSAAKLGIGALFFTTEMTREEMLLRFVAQEASVDTTRFRDRQAREPEWAELFRRIEDLATLPLEIVEAKDMRIDQVAAMSRRYADTMHKTHGVPLGVVAYDYVQRMPPPNGLRSARKYDVVSENTKGLKKLAQELRLPVVEMAQMKNLPLDLSTKIRERPSTGAVADSQEIEKEADVVIYLYRKPLMYGQRARGESKREITCALDKQRGGPPGETHLWLEGEFQRFRDDVRANATAGADD